MTTSDKGQDPTAVSISTPIPGDAPEENSGHNHIALGVNVQDMVLLAELVGSATREMKGLMDAVERCLYEAGTLAESDGITLDEDIDVSLSETAVSVRSVARRSEHIAGVAGVALSQPLAHRGSELQKAVVRTAVAQVNSGWPYLGGAAAVKPQARGVNTVVACPVGGKPILAM